MSHCVNSETFLMLHTVMLAIKFPATRLASCEVSTTNCADYVPGLSRWVAAGFREG